MDDLVKAAMAKWPHVPACYGWLGLDARGDWWLRDIEAQSAGPFAGPGANRSSKGTRVHHEKLRLFIERNYACDDSGQWYFQNGPQRVFVELELAPWVLRMDAGGALHTHCGAQVVPLQSYVDEQGHVYALTERGLGVLHSLDMHLVADAVERGTWAPTDCEQERMPAQFGYALSPLARMPNGVRDGG